MGFEPQVLEVLESMGGLLKSEDEEQAEQQLANDATNFRVTAMVCNMNAVLSILLIEICCFLCLCSFLLLCLQRWSESLKPIFVILR